MKAAPRPANEERRLAAVQALHLLDTPAEERFDRITKRAVKELHVPISTITILDKDREWFKSCQGVLQREDDRTLSFCGHAMFAPGLFIVENTAKDSRFADNPHVIGPPYIRFYAGMPLYGAKTGQSLGVFCVKDTKPRSLTQEELALFLELSKDASRELNTPSLTAQHHA